MYLHRCESPSEKKSAAGFQDLNYPPNLAEDASLDLKLVPSAESQSVCTLDKVKSALERAKRESTKKRPSVASYGGGSDASSSRIYSSLSSPSSQSSTISIKGGEEEGEVEAEDPKKSSLLVFAAGCPGCLLYVLISKANPRCPRCGAVVPAPVLKKPRVNGRGERRGAVANSHATVRGRQTQRSTSPSRHRRALEPAALNAESNECERGPRGGTRVGESGCSINGRRRLTRGVSKADGLAINAASRLKEGDDRAFNWQG
ncbi:hypothetical protein ACLOJK_021574 [Asimina triloba]